MDYETAMEHAGRVISPRMVELKHAEGLVYVNAAHIVRIEADERASFVRLADGSAYAVLVDAETAQDLASRICSWDICRGPKTNS